MAIEVPPGTPDRRAGIEAMCIALMVLTIITTIARITSKFVVKQYWWWDDFFAILSLPCQLGILGVILAWTKIGLGLHAELVAAHNPLYLLEGAKYLYIAIFFFDATICFPKLAALCFYARVFRSNNKILRMQLWIAGSLVAGWLVAALISTVFQCTPIEKAWNQMLPGKCINTYAWYLATASLSSVIDTWILLIPVPIIWKLNVSLRRRVYLLGAFFLTYSVIVLSLGRLISTTKLIPTLAEDLTWKMPSYIYWACFEGSVSLISINIPNIIALVKALAGPRWHRTRSNDSESKRQTGQTSRSYGGVTDKVGGSQAYNDGHHGFERLVSSEGPVVSDSSSQTRLEPAETGEAPIELGGIHVQTEILVESRAGRREFEHVRGLQGLR